MLNLKLFNTKSRQVEEFKSITPFVTTMYACGPTVYNYAHIGNMRAYIVQDILNKILSYAGYDVKHVMNITDVGHLQSDQDEGDDKMAIAAKREQKSPWEIARYYEEIFFKHTAILNIKSPDVVCRATDHIDDMIEMIQELIKLDYAYTSNNNVYFDISKFSKYHEFARLNIDQQQQTDRVERDRYKRNAQDFVLWFSESKYPNQIMKWNSAWGIGFPGWHIECSAMASKYLGEHFDIHCGGIDHIAVHHTNEIAQSECYHGCSWVNYWIHNEFVNIEDSKMSKSKGNILTIDKLIQSGFSPLDYRYLLLTVHYRSVMTLNNTALVNAQKSLNYLRNMIILLKKEPEQKIDDEKCAKTKDEFWKIISDDIHTPKALALLWEVARDIKYNASEKLMLLADFDRIFSLNLLADIEIKLTDEQKDLLSKRERARECKNWQESDKLRDELLRQNIQVNDTSKGTDIIILPSIGNLNL